MLALYCALFWIQGKTDVSFILYSLAIVLCLILDSRQNLSRMHLFIAGIVLCLILDSRQNKRLEMLGNTAIVLCLILDSRQNLKYNPI